MSTTYAGSLLCILIALLGLALAAVPMLVMGLRGRRLDDHPVCRRCRFDLVGLPEGVTICSECGADLTQRKAIVHGNRQRRPLLALLGALPLVLIVLIAGLIAYRAYESADRYRLTPTWWLMFEAQRVADSGSAARSVPSWRELTRRLKAGSLSDERIAAAVETVLKLQGDTSKPWSGDFGDFVESARAAGKVSDAQWQRYARQAPQLAMVLRDKVRPGFDLPAGVRLASPRAASNGKLVFRMMREHGAGELTRDRPPDKNVTGYVAHTLSANGGGGSNPHTIPLDQNALTAAAPGLREAKLIFDAEVREGWDRDDPAIVAWTQTLTGTWTLVPKQTQTVTLVADEQIRPQMQQGVTIEYLGYRQPQWGGLNIDVETTTLPAPLAHDVILRDPATGREWHLSSITVHPNVNTGYGTGGTLKDFSLSVVDVILRPNADVAERTVEMTSVWNGELVFKNVPVQRGPASRPARR